MKVVITLLFLVFAIGCGGSNEPSQLTDIERALATPVGSVVTSQNVLQTTSKGVLVYSQNGIEATLLTEIDKGFQEMHNNALLDGFKNNKQLVPSDFEIFIAPYTCPPEGFYLNSGEAYDGSQYDKWNPKGYGVKDGKSVITAAEKVLSSNNSEGNSQIYICDTPSVVRNAVQYGAEHVFLSKFSYNEENRNKPPYDGNVWFIGSLNHSGGISHPLLTRGER